MADFVLSQFCDVCDPSPSSLHCDYPHAVLVASGERFMIRVLKPEYAQCSWCRKCTA